jgi:hypothetical protein
VRELFRSASPLASCSRIASRGDATVHLLTDMIGQLPNPDQD